MSSSVAGEQRASYFHSYQTCSLRPHHESSTRLGTKDVLDSLLSFCIPNALAVLNDMNSDPVLVPP